MLESTLTTPRSQAAHISSLIQPARAVLVCLPVVLAALTAFLDPVFAQAPPSDAGQIERRIEQTEPEPIPGGLDRIHNLPAPQPTADEDIRFILSAVVVEGITVLDPLELGHLYEEFLARLVTPVVADTIAERITRLYRDRGYFLSRVIIPPQIVTTGILRINVIEGFIEQVDFSGAANLTENLSGYAAAITRESPATLAMLERNILLINDLAGLTVVRSDLEEPTSAGSGAYRLTLSIEHDKVDANLYFDNRGTPSVGRAQSWSSVAENGLLGMNERLQLGFFTVPTQPDELQYVETSYQQPLGTGGLDTELSLSASRVDAGSELGPVDSESASERAELRIGYAATRARQQSLWINTILDYSNSTERRSGASYFDDRVRVLRLRPVYRVQNEAFSLSLTATASQGIDILGASHERSGPLSRVDGQASFSKLTVDTLLTLVITEKWRALFAFNGQKSAHALLSAEEFAIGGNRFGRAYDFGAISGEDGAAGSLEVQYDLAASIEGFDSFELYGFYDIGAVWNRNSDDADRRDSLSSAGGGIRFGFTGDATASFELAQPLTRGVVTSNNDNGARIFITLSLKF